MEIDIIESLDGYSIPRINKEGKIIHLTSLYNTQREIDKLIRTLEKYNLSDTTVVFGISNFEYIKFIKRFINENFYIVEPTEELRELAKKELSKNIKVLSVEDVCTISFIKSIKDKTVNFLSYGSYAWVFRDEFNKINQKLYENVMYTQVVENTRRYFEKTWITAFFENLPHIISSESIDDYKNKHLNKPAIIVSAGPSLEKTIPILKNVHENFIIISGGRTLKTLKNNGIHCDYTCVIDAGEGSYEVIKEAIDYDTTLVYSDITNSKIVNEFKGRKIYFNSNEASFIRNKLMDDCNSRIYTGSSVAHTCVGFSIHIGCSPMIFIGQDLAFTNNKMHADSASIVTEEENKTEDSSVKVENVFGEDVSTSRSLLGFLRELEYLIKTYTTMNNNLEFINCSEGGAKIEGAAYLDFKSVVQNYTKAIEKEYNRESCYINQYKIESLVIRMKNCLNEINKGEKYLLKYEMTIKNLIDDINLYNEKELNKVICDIKRIGKKVDSTYLSVIIKYFNYEKKYLFEEIEYREDKDEVEKSLTDILSMIKVFKEKIFLLRNEMDKCLLDLTKGVNNE